jgi:hypothetical protein
MRQFAGTIALIIAIAVIGFSAYGEFKELRAGFQKTTTQYHKAISGGN